MYITLKKYIYLVHFLVFITLLFSLSSNLMTQSGFWLQICSLPYQIEFFRVCTLELDFLVLYLVHTFERHCHLSWECNTFSLYFELSGSRSVVYWCNGFDFDHIYVLRAYLIYCLFGPSNQILKGFLVDFLLSFFLFLSMYI